MWGWTDGWMDGGRGKTPSAQTQISLHPRFHNQLELEPWNRGARRGVIELCLVLSCLDSRLFTLFVPQRLTSVAHCARVQGAGSGSMMGVTNK